MSASAERRPLILRAGGAIAVTTIASGVETAQRPTLSAVEQLAAYFYADTLVLLRRTGLHLAQALAVAALADDPDLFLQLLAAALEHLLSAHLRAELPLAA